MNLNDKYEPHACSNCGELHTCTGEMNCWCTEVEIPENAQDYIMACFDGCLCHKCIKEVEQTVKDNKL